MTQSDIELDLGTDSLTCTTEEIAATFAGLLREMRAAVGFIRPDERAVLRRIMSYDSGALTVADVFPNFERGSEAHATLRRLRTAQFILPAGRDMWDRDQHIAIKPFARLAWDRFGEASLFGGDSEIEMTIDEEVVDLSQPEVNDSAEKETLRMKEKTTGKWDDDDVLDFLTDSKERMA